MDVILPPSLEAVGPFLTEWELSFHPISGVSIQKENWSTLPIKSS